MVHFVTNVNLQQILGSCCYITNSNVITCKYLLRRCQEFSELLICRPLVQRLLGNIILYSKTSLGFLAKKTTCKFVATPTKKPTKNQFSIKSTRLFVPTGYVQKSHAPKSQFPKQAIWFRCYHKSMQILIWRLPFRRLKKLARGSKTLVRFQSSTVMFLQAASETFKMLEGVRNFMEMIKKGASLEWLRRIFGRGRP